MIKIDLPKTTPIMQEAAFKAGSAGKVIGLVLKVLSKRLSTQFKLSPIPWTYKSTDGQFEGYYAFFGNMNSSIRLNFLLGKSDKIVSVDYFEAATQTPKLSIDLNGINIVQVIDVVVGVIDGTYNAQLEDYMMDEMPLEEARVSVKDMVFEWVGSIDASDLTSGRKNWGELYSSFSQYADSQRWRVPAMNGFKWGVKEYATEFNLRTNILSPRVRRGAPETAVVVDTASQRQFTTLTVENEHLKKFDMLETYVRMIGRQSNKLNAMIIYGQAGIGKTTMVKNVFKDMGLTAGVDYVIKSGSISGKTGLRQLLWDYREDMIIVLDDNDGILKNMDAVNMLKPALQDKDRIVSMTKAKSTGRARPAAARSEESVNEETIDLTSMDSDAGIDRARLDQQELDRAEREAAAEAERIEREAEEERERIANQPIPDDFEFKSKMIFVSNLMDFPAALKSRSIAIKIDMSVEQTMDLIKTNLDKVMSEFDEITIEMKQDVFNFISEIAGSLESMDFRQFQFALIPYMAIVEDGGNPRTDTSWQDWAIIQLTS